MFGFFKKSNKKDNKQQAQSKKDKEKVNGRNGRQNSNLKKKRYPKSTHMFGFFKKSNKKDKEEDDSNKDLTVDTTKRDEPPGIPTDLSPSHARERSVRFFFSRYTEIETYTISIISQFLFCSYLDTTFILLFIDCSFYFQRIIN